MCNHRGIERTLNAATGLHSALVHQARPAKAPLFVAGMKAGVGVEAGHPRGVDFRLPQRPLHWTSLVSSKRHKSGRQLKCYSWKGSSAGVGLAQNLFFSKKQTLETIQDFLIKLGIKPLITVWPQSIWIKVRTLWQIPLQHQSTYLGGPESALIEIPPFQTFFMV